MSGEDKLDPRTEDDGIIRLIAEEFKQKLRDAAEWRIWTDSREEYVLAAKTEEDGPIQTYKGPDPMFTDMDTVMAFMFDVIDLMDEPDVSKNKR